MANKISFKVVDDVVVVAVVESPRDEMGWDGMVYLFSFAILESIVHRPPPPERKEVRLRLRLSLSIPLLLRPIDSRREDGLLR
jgi:hypothetical protein